MKIRGYQSDAVNSVKQAIKEGCKSMAVVMPTASGKTYVFGNITKDYIEENKHSNVVIISHLSLLTKQTGDRFKSDWGIDSEVLQADVIPSGKSQCIITTMQSFKIESKINRWSRNLGSFKGSASSARVGMIIIDEAHYMGSESYNKILAMFPEAIIIGFTATPFKSNKLMTNIFERVAFTISMGELIDNGYLVPPVLKITKFNTADESDLYASILEIINNNKGKKAVVYLKTIAESEECRDILIANNIKCSSITSRFSGKARDKILQEYKDGIGPDVLTTVDVLTAGFDSPNLSIIIMPYKVGSLTSYLQRIGRGLRLFPGKKQCDVYVGGINPKVESGFWEKITRDMLKQGKSEYDNYLDDFEFLKDELTSEELTWTIDVLNMAKAVSGKNMKNLYASIICKEFPTDLLDVFVEHVPLLNNKKLLDVPATEKQLGYLKDKNIDASDFSKGEAMATISAVIKKEGKYNPRDIVPSGKYKGYFFNEVPFSYWSFIGGGRNTYKYMNSGLLKKYKEYKQRRGI